MIAPTDAETEPQTLAEIAAELDQHRKAIADLTTDRDEYVERIDTAIRERQQAAGGLLALRARMERASFGDAVTSAAPASRARGAKHASRNGSPSPAVPANIAARQRNAAIRRYAKEHRLDCPETGSNFPPELTAAFDRDGGYQG